MTIPAEPPLTVNEVEIMEANKGLAERGNANAAFEVNHILMPTDFSACAEEALAFAVALGAEHGAKIRLLHVLTFYEPELDGTVQDTPYAAALRERLEADAWERLADAVRSHAEGGVKIEPVVQAQPRSCRSRGRGGARLRGRPRRDGHARTSGVDRFFLGSVAEEVVWRASVSVLTVREKAPRAMNHVRRILAPTDLSGCSSEAVAVAKSLAARYGAAVGLLYVVEPIPFPASISVGSQNVYDYLPELRRELVKALECLAGQTPETEVEVHIEEGHAAHAIARFAEAHASDLIVMATQGRSGLARFFIGSVAERVVRTAPCPVLTVRTKAASSEMQTAASAKPHQEVMS